MYFLPVLIFISFVINFFFYCMCCVVFIDLKTCQCVNALLLTPMPHVQEGKELMEEQPELGPAVQQKLKEMRECWTHLESTTKAKARQLFETQNHRTTEPVQQHSLSDLDQQLSVLQEEPAHTSQPTLHPSLHSSLHSSHTSHTPHSGASTSTVLLQPRTTFSQQLQRIQVNPSPISGSSSA